MPFNNGTVNGIVNQLPNFSYVNSTNILTNDLTSDTWDLSAFDLEAACRLHNAALVDSAIADESEFLTPDFAEIEELGGGKQKVTKLAESGNLAAAWAEALKFAV